MTNREAILGFHQAERGKSQLLLIHRLIEVVESLPDEERTGGRNVLTQAVRWIRAEISRAKASAPHIQWERALQWMDDVEDAVEAGRYAQASEAVSRCISAVTTVGQGSMEALLERGLL